MSIVLLLCLMLVSVSECLNHGILIVGGIGTGGTAQPVAQIYNPNLANYSVTINFTQALNPDNGPSSAVLNGLAYISGGIQTPASLFILDIVNETIKAGPNLASPRYLHSSAALLNKIYLCGGFDNNTNELATCEVFDPSTNKWSTSRQMPQSRQTHSAVTWNNKMYIIGGQIQGADTATVATFNPQSPGLEWDNGPSLKQARSDFGAAAVPNGGGIVVCGGLYMDQALATCEMLTKTTWTPIVSLQNARSGLRLATFSGKLFALGGYSFAAQVFYNTVEFIDYSHNQTTLLNKDPINGERAEFAAIEV